MIGDSVTENVAIDDDVVALVEPTEPVQFPEKLASVARL
jgi:hypothetical protein